MNHKSPSLYLSAAAAQRAFSGIFSVFKCTSFPTPGRPIHGLSAWLPRRWHDVHRRLPQRSRGTYPGYHAWHGAQPHRWHLSMTKNSACDMRVPAPMGHPQSCAPKFAHRCQQQWQPAQHRQRQARIRSLSEGITGSLGSAFWSRAELTSKDKLPLTALLWRGWVCMEISQKGKKFGLLMVTFVLQMFFV